MEPINIKSISTGMRRTLPISSTVEPTVKATKNTELRAEFVSPKGSIDAKSGVYVVQFRNSSTGNVNFQYPNKKVVAEYSRADKLVSSPEVTNQGSSSETVASNIEQATVKGPSPAPAVPSVEPTTSSVGTVATPLGTTDNV
jgi:hypothetical protein